MQIVVERHIFTDTTSSGTLSIDGQYFCETLEDAARAYGVKVKHKTCLPVGAYQVTITPSVRFERLMLQLYTTATDLSCELGGIRFTGIRVHGGNTHESTSGCPIVAFDRVSPERIKRSAEGPLFERVKVAIHTGERVTWVVRNRPAAVSG